MYSYEMLFCEDISGLPIRLMSSKVIKVQSITQLPYHPTILQLKEALNEKSYGRVIELYYDEGFNLILCDTKILACLSDYTLNTYMELMPNQFHFEFESDPLW